MTIMFIDTDIDRKAMAEALRFEPITVLAVSKGGQSALEQLHEQNYEVDAIVMDLALQDMDGYSLTRTIRTNEILRNLEPIPIFWVKPSELRSDNYSLLKFKEEFGIIEVLDEPNDAVQTLKIVKEYLTLQEISSSNANNRL